MIKLLNLGRIKVNRLKRWNSVPGKFLFLDRKYICQRVGEYICRGRGIYLPEVRGIYLQG